MSPGQGSQVLASHSRLPRRLREVSARSRQHVAQGVPLERLRTEAGPPELARWVREGLGQGGAGGATSGTVLEDT